MLNYIQNGTKDILKALSIFFFFEDILKLCDNIGSFFHEIGYLVDRIGLEFSVCVYKIHFAVLIADEKSHRNYCKSRSAAATEVLTEIRRAIFGIVVNSARCYSDGPPDTRIVEASYRSLRSDARDQRANCHTSG